MFSCRRAVSLLTFRNSYLDKQDTTTRLRPLNSFRGGKKPRIEPQAASKATTQQQNNHRSR
jgi:hypothetical protein